MDTPIVLLAFRRPDHTRCVLESLTTNPEAANSRLFVFIDGPKREGDVHLGDEVEKIATSQRWCGSVEVVRRTENWGVPRQTTTTVAEMVDRFGTVLVLEDDQYVSPHFLSFMQNALQRYRDDERVMEVSGYRYPARVSPGRSGFLRSSIGWGWATWKRAWEKYEPDGTKLLDRIISNRAWEREFDVNGSFPFTQMLRDQIAGKIGGWDIRWSASILLNGGFALYPAQSLVRNIGLDGTGTNCGVDDIYNTEIAETPIVDFPNDVSVDPIYYKALQRFFRRANGRSFRTIGRKLKILGQAMGIPQNA